MCGIAGYFGTREISDKSLSDCLKKMKHRGPDASGIAKETLPEGKRLYLLHSRLSIIDLDPRSNQPFENEKGILVYNGELYNYLELKEELQNNSYPFKTSSDTEVLMALLQESGDYVLGGCEGMWAFAYFDKSTKNLILSRDRFGEKPLYMYGDNSGLYFASEIGFITAMLGKSLSVSYDQISRYLVNGYKSLYKTSTSFFKGLKELDKGSSLTVTASGAATSRRYWNVDVPIQEEMSWEEAIVGARETLFRSIEIRLRADVPMAFCLSGGIDSNALVGIAKKVFGYDVHGFTIVNEDVRYEERDMVNLAKEDYGIQHTEIPVDTAHFLEKLREQLRQHASPISTITYYAQWRLMEAVAQAGYKISVSGTGADELFSGYYDHHLAYLKEVKKYPNLYASSLDNWEIHVKGLVRNPFLSDPDLFVNNPNHRDHIYLGAKEFRSCLTQQWFEPFEEEKYHDDLLRNRMMNEMFHESVPVILHEDDLNAMSFSIENRSPFLDCGLYDFCASIPTRHLVSKGLAKSVLREACRDIVPNEILDNPRKVGFNAPLLSYLDTQDPRVMNELLEDSPIFEMVKKDKIKDMLSQKELPNSQSKFLFNFLNSKIFLEMYS